MNKTMTELAITTPNVADDGEEKQHGTSQGQSPSKPSSTPNDGTSRFEIDLDGAADDAETITGVRWFMICLGIFSANILYGLDTTITADIQSAVSKSFQNVTQLGWLGVGFNLGSTVAILPLGKAYATFDTKWLFIGCLTMFAAGSALCGAAPNMSAMIVGRVWAGAGGAGMYLGTLHLVSSTTSARRRAFFNGLIGFVYGGGCILGPIVGGSLSDSKATWRWSFYLNLVIFGIMSPVYIFALPSLPKRTDQALVHRLHKGDWLGTILIAALHVSLVLAFSFGGSIWGWDDGRFIALLVLFFAFTAAFAVQQYSSFFTTIDDRLFPCDLLGNFQFVLLYMTMACGGAALFVTVYYIPLFFLFVYGDTGTEAAVRLLPFVCFYVVSILLCGYALPRTGYHFVWYLISGLLLTAGGAAMHILKFDSPAAHVYGVSVLLGIGLTTSQAGYDVACRTAASIQKDDKIPEVLQYMNISQGQSQLLGLVIASSIFQNEAFKRMQVVLKGSGFTESQIHQAIAGAGSEVFRTISGDLRNRALEAIVRVIDMEWILVMAAGALQTVCALFMTKTKFP